MARRRTKSKGFKLNDKSISYVGEQGRLRVDGERVHGSLYLGQGAMLRGSMSLRKIAKIIGSLG